MAASLQRSETILSLRRELPRTIRNGGRLEVVFDFRMGREREGPKRFVDQSSSMLLS